MTQVKMRKEKKMAKKSRKMLFYRIGALVLALLMILGSVALILELLL